MELSTKEKDFQEKVGYFLKEARLKYTYHSGNYIRIDVLKQSAEVVGVTIDSLYKWEQGRTKPSLYQLKLLCDFYQTDICELLNKVERGYCEKTRVAQ